MKHPAGKIHIVFFPLRDVSVLCCTQSDVEPHGFGDSPSQAFCALVFVRVMCSHDVSVNLYARKCRLAPMRNFSIACVELLFCLVL